VGYCKFKQFLNAGVSRYAHWPGCEDPGGTKPFVPPADNPQPKNQILFK